MVVSPAYLIDLHVRHSSKSFQNISKLLLSNTFKYLVQLHSSKGSGSAGTKSKPAHSMTANVPPKNSRHRIVDWRSSNQDCSFH